MSDTATIGSTARRRADLVNQREVAPRPRTSTSCSAAGTSATCGWPSACPARTSGRSSRRRASPARSSTAWATRTSSGPTTTAASSGCRSASSTPSRGGWSIYWADSRRCGVLDPPVFGTFDGDVGVFEGEDTFCRAADPRPVLLVRRHHVDTALGAVVLARRRRELGDELGDGVHARRGGVMSTSTLPGVSPDYRHVTKSIAPAAVLELRSVSRP